MIVLGLPASSQQYTDAFMLVSTTLSQMQNSLHMAADSSLL